MICSFAASQVILRPCERRCCRGGRPLRAVGRFRCRKSAASRFHAVEEVLVVARASHKAVDRLRRSGRSSVRPGWRRFPCAKRRPFLWNRRTSAPIGMSFCCWPTIICMPSGYWNVTRQVSVTIVPLLRMERRRAFDRRPGRLHPSPCPNERCRCCGRRSSSSGRRSSPKRSGSCNERGLVVGPIRSGASQRS